MNIKTFKYINKRLHWEITKMFKHPQEKKIIKQYKRLYNIYTSIIYIL